MTTSSTNVLCNYFVKIDFRGGLCEVLPKFLTYGIIILKGEYHEIRKTAKELTGYNICKKA